jgi:hypothetical protein
MCGRRHGKADAGGSILSPHIPPLSDLHSNDPVLLASPHRILPDPSAPSVAMPKNSPEIPTILLLSKIPNKGRKLN